MSEGSTTARLLRLLELLQARRSWPGTELAGRLEVTPRTLRRDVQRLRELGYRIAARRGPEGGYQLTTGTRLPPLVFTPDEATAIAAALSSSAALSDELTLTALAKVEQVLPAAARTRVLALRSSVSLGVRAGLVPVDPAVLAVLALACRDSERLRVHYAGGSDPEPGRARRVEPLNLVPHGARWYLLCWDLDREDWRTLRVDRVTRAEATGVRARPRPVPGGDAAAFVAQRFGHGDVQHAATIRIHAPLPEVVAHLGAYSRDLAADRTDAGHPATRWRIADVRLELLASALLWLRWPYEVLDSEELRALLRETSARFAAAAGRGDQSTSSTGSPSATGPGSTTDP